MAIIERILEWLAGPELVVVLGDEHRRPVGRDDRPSPRGTPLVIGTHITTLHAALRRVIGTKGHPQFR